MTTDEFDLFKDKSVTSDKAECSPMELDHDVLTTSDKMVKTIASIDCKPPLILIIDDDPTVRDSLGYALEQDYHLIFCTSGEEGIQTVNRKVSVVVLDIKMEGKDGFQTFTEIKKKFSHLPIIFHSAYQDLKNPYDVMNEYRPFGYISKEGGPKELSDTVVSAVEYHRQIRKNEILVDELQSLNATLEDKVTERTQALKTTLNQVEQQSIKLNEALQQLEEKHIELKQTQAQLVQSGKMASLGTLVAGMAHEINNPLNFVKMGTHSAESELQDFKHLIFGILEKDSDPDILQEFRKRFDTIASSLETIYEGNERIQTIVKDLRTFSRLDEAKRKTVDLAKSLKSTLRLVQTQYQDTVKFVEDFQTESKIECWPALLNQVFMNLIINACQAIETQQKQKGEKTQGTLTIRIFSQEKYLVIRFEDTGHGMSEEVKNQIFDPFFTTKEVGEGTGLGMTITFGIIEQHQGRIEVESELNQGTSITLFLPLKGIAPH